MASPQVNGEVPHSAFFDVSFSLALHFALNNGH